MGAVVVPQPPHETGNLEGFVVAGLRGGVDTEKLQGVVIGHRLYLKGDGRTVPSVVGACVRCREVTVDGIVHIGNDILQLFGTYFDFLTTGEDTV